VHSLQTSGAMGSDVTQSLKTTHTLPQGITHNLQVNKHLTQMVCFLIYRKFCDLIKDDMYRIVAYF